jgi:hypothetical protein
MYACIPKYFVLFLGIYLSRHKKLSPCRRAYIDLLRTDICNIHRHNKVSPCGRAYILQRHSLEARTQCLKVQTGHQNLEMDSDSLGAE